MVGQLEDPFRSLLDEAMMKPVENSDQNEENRFKRRFRIHSIRPLDMYHIVIITVKLNKRLEILQLCENAGHF
jgi:hypothetical protein